MDDEDTGDRILKKQMILLLLICAGWGVIPIFAVDSSISLAYKQIDTAFINHSDTDLDTVLRGEQENSDYDLIETYTMKKIRRLVISNDFKFAEQSILVVIDNNLENTEAVEMYAEIQDSLEKQEAYEKLQEAKRIAERERIEREKEAQRTKADKEFQTAKTAAGKSVYITGKEEKYSSAYWNTCFGLAGFTLISETPDDYSSLRYGLSAAFTYEYEMQQKYVFGLDVFTEGIILPLYNDDKTMLGSVKLAPKVSFAGFNKKIFFRAGFASLVTAAAGSVTVLQGTFLTPFAGIGFSHVNLGNMVLSGFYDYYAGHLFYGNINSAMGTGLNIALPIAELERIKLNFNVGLNDNLYIKNEGIENHAGIIFAIGVENVTK
ncbi:MAG: hypothetical protein M0P01_03840 [Treponema sp.]|nr:hypothetical protein [Treponema sp.]